MNISFVYSRKAKNSCALAFIVALSMIVISWISIKYPNNNMPEYMGRIFGLSIPYIVCAIYVSIYILSKGKAFKNLKYYWRFCIPICIPLVFHGFSQVILAQTDKIMLQKVISDNSVVGIYSFFVTFIHILNAIYTALNNTWIPIYYKYIGEGNHEALKKKTSNYIKLFSILVIGFMLVAPEVVKLFADKKYWGGMSLIPIVAVSIYMVFMYSFAVNYELYHMQSKWIAFGTTASAVLNIVFNAVFIPKWGMHGAALATLGAYTALYIFHDMCARKIKVKGEYPYKQSFFFKNIFIVLAVGIVFYIIKDIWQIRWIFALIDGVYLVYQVCRNKSIF